HLHPQAVARVVRQARAVLQATVDVVHVIGDGALELALDRHHLAIGRQGGRRPGGTVVRRLSRRLRLVLHGFHQLAIAMLFHARGGQGLVDRLDPQHVGIAGPDAAPGLLAQGRRRCRQGGEQEACRWKAHRRREPVGHGNGSVCQGDEPSLMGASPERAATLESADYLHVPDMSLHLYNSLTRRVEPFVPLDPACPTMYLCGPTVYNYVHIGNARGPVVFDVLAALLRRRHGRLRYARNITDVDDKINAAARQASVPISAITDRYAAAYREDMAALGVVPQELQPAATAHIPQIIAMVQALVERGHAYEAEGHVLFAVESYEGYGKLSRRDPEEMLAGARVEVAPYKRHPGDFVLWKPSSDDLPGWDSLWGRGRPGWHIECSAMAAAHLGQTIDIHAGGIDLQFPHHENEIAQSECAHGGAPFARFWLHNGMLNFGGAKMSKSLGNIEKV